MGFGPTGWVTLFTIPVFGCPVVPWYTLAEPIGDHGRIFIAFQTADFISVKLAFCTPLTAAQTLPIFLIELIFTQGTNIVKPVAVQTIFLAGDAFLPMILMKSIFVTT
jgi:hypothetical protein